MNFFVQRSELRDLYDKVAAGELKTADKKTTAPFTYTRGLTRDLRRHVRLFVVPKDAEVKVETGK